MKYLMAVGRRKQYMLIVIIILTATTFYLFGIREETFHRSSIKLFSLDENMAFTGFLVHTPSCRIPEMNPFDVSVQKYLKKAPVIECSDRLPLIESNQTSIWIVREALESYNVSNESDLNCCYSSIRRKKVDLKKIDTNIDNSLKVGTKCTPFGHSANIHYEFIQVKCVLNNVEIYKDYHAFVVPKIKPNSTNGTAGESEGLSVLIIGADALSRLNFYRQMPKTKGLMLSIGAFEFFGYNKVHDNTFPNLVPLLSGYSVDEIRELCWLNDSSFFDDCPWIWKNFSSKDYFTAFAEDACWMGLFNYGKKGFYHPPTDYYLRPYIQANEDGIGHSRFLNTKYCDGARFAAEVLFDYAYKFSVNMTLSNKKFWGFFWESSLTHDFLNVPPNNDEIFYSLIKSFEENNVLNSTAVFFMSDHGMRWGSIRETYQGRMEENLPFLYIILPEWFQMRYSTAVNNLKLNAHLLTTHYDVHETMKDLLNLDNLNEDNLESRISESRDSRGVSLFLPVSVHRTCKSAGIRPKWCTCQKNKRVSKVDRQVLRAAKLTVDYLNSMMSKYKQCARLKLEKVISAHIEVEDDIMNASTRNQFSDYVIIIVTTPGFAKFESTVRHRSGTDEMNVLRDISRINLYGDQSRCVTNYRPDVQQHFSYLRGPMMPLKSSVRHRNKCTSIIVLDYTQNLVRPKVIHCLPKFLKTVKAL